MTEGNTLAGIPLKYLSLISLTLQNSLLAILLHHSRTVSNTKLYSASAAVLLNEILKCLISFSVALYNSYHSKSSSSPSLSSNPSTNKYSLDKGYILENNNVRINSNSNLRDNESTAFLRRGSVSSIFEQDFEDWKRSSRGTIWNLFRHSKIILSEIISGDCWKLSIPAILYVVQNNLQFVAAANLDVATFSVTYQLKILTTAMCSVVMLRRRLSTSKWISLFFLAVGVALVQLQHAEADDSSKKRKSDQLGTADRFIGFVAVTSACFTSGLAGVYFELVLKSSNKVDLWIRNIQLSLFSLLPALFTTLMTTSNHEGHLFSNFGFWAWATVLTQVVGGLVTALVIKFADNILKGFATSLSIILSTLAGVFLFGTPLPSGSALGALVVLISTYAYNSSPDNPTPSLNIIVNNNYSSLLNRNSNNNGNNDDENSIPTGSSTIVSTSNSSSTLTLTPPRSHTPPVSNHQYHIVGWNENSKSPPVRRSPLIGGKEKERIS